MLAVLTSKNNFYSSNNGYLHKYEQEGNVSVAMPTKRVAPKQVPIVLQHVTRAMHEKVMTGPIL